MYADATPLTDALQNWVEFVLSRLQEDQLLLLLLLRMML